MSTQATYHSSVNCHLQSFTQLWSFTFLTQTQSSSLIHTCSCFFFKYCMCSSVLLAQTKKFDLDKGTRCFGGRVPVFFGCWFLYWKCKGSICCLSVDVYCSLIRFNTYSIVYTLLFICAGNDPYCWYKSWTRIWKFLYSPNHEIWWGKVTKLNYYIFKVFCYCTGCSCNQSFLYVLTAWTDCHGCRSQLLNSCRVTF